DAHSAPCRWRRSPAGHMTSAGPGAAASLQAACRRGDRLNACFGQGQFLLVSRSPTFGLAHGHHRPTFLPRARSSISSAYINASISVSKLILCILPVSLLLTIHSAQKGAYHLFSML